MEPDHGNGDQSVDIPAQEWASKFANKRSIYTFMTTEIKAFLPPFQTITVYFLVSSNQKYTDHSRKI